MFWRQRKVLRDRAAGMVFDWRRGHGSARRFLLGFLISGSVWGFLFAYVQIRGPKPPILEDERIDLTLVDLDQEENRWLAELIDRETLFQQHWPVSQPERVEKYVQQTLAETSPQVYEPTLREIARPRIKPELSNLPGWEAGNLPEPDRVASVAFANPPVNWWIEVEEIEGPEGFEPFAFPFPWPEDPDLMSEGDSWAVILAVDWRGVVVSIDGWWERSDDPRTPAILEKIRARAFAQLSAEGPLRIWRLHASLVNRPPAE